MVEDEGVRRWEMPCVLPARDGGGGGFVLGDQVFCVQNGSASPRFLESIVSLVSKRFNSETAQLSDELAPGGLRWDFIVAVHRGTDVNDVVAACILVYGRSDGRQYFYVFDVCTHPSMARRGLAKVVMSAAYRLCGLVWRERGNGRVLSYSDRLWLLLEVDLAGEQASSSSSAVSADDLIKFYTRVGYAQGTHVFPVTPLESKCRRWYWCVTVDPKTRCQLEREVFCAGEEDPYAFHLKPEVLEELLRGSSSGSGRGTMNIIALRFEQLLDMHMMMMIIAATDHRR
jgi:hypothetical protein